MSKPIIMTALFKYKKGSLFLCGQVHREDMSYLQDFTADSIRRFCDRRRIIESWYVDAPSNYWIDMVT